MSNHFSNKSLTELETCDERLQELFFEVLEHFDCTIVEGSRSRARQDELYAQGKSKLVWPFSKHNCPDGEPSRAVDATPYPIDWEDTLRLYAFAGFVLGVAARMGIPLRCGMDWDQDWSFKDQGFHDVGHFELMED